MDDWLEHINDGEITGACLLDISKCFDSINNIFLLTKLERYGISGTALNWFSSYLSGRIQFVNFNNETSESCEIACGVPQGQFAALFYFHCSLMTSPILQWKVAYSICMPTM